MDMESIWEIIQRKLEENDIATFPPATKVGECKSEYVVLKEGGSAQVQSYSSEYVYYQFMLYVPVNKYHTLSDFEQRVKTILNEQLHPLIRSTGSNNPDYYDEEVKAHMRSFTYRNIRRNKYM